MIFLIIAKFEEILLTKTWLKLQIWQKFPDFLIFPSHIFRLADKKFTKLSQKSCLMMFLIIAKFEEILLTETWLKL